MRKGLIALLILSLGCTACGRTERKLVPVEGSVALANGNFFGRLQMTDGAELAIKGGGRVGRWICGEAEISGPDFCVPLTEVRALVDHEYRVGAEAVFLIPMAGVAAVWVGSDELKRRKRAREDAEDAELRRRGLLPPLPTPEARRRGESEAGLRACFDIPFADRETTDTAALARGVWEKRDRCIIPAAHWFSSHEELDKGRRLFFVAAARRRYESLACQDRDPGLDAPPRGVIADSDARWMDEFRAVAADDRTYDYTPEACAPSREQAVAIRRSVISSFPLTLRPTPSTGPAG